MNRKSLLFWMGLSLGAHLALFVFWPALRPLPGGGRKALPVHLVAPSPAAALLERPLPPAASPTALPPAPPPSKTAAPAKSGIERKNTASPRLPSPAVQALSPLEKPSVPKDLSPSPAPSGVPAVHRIGPEIESDPAGAPVSEETVRAADGPPEDAVPLYDRNPPPRYPRLAQKRGWQGEVLLRVRVALTGETREVRLERSCGHAVLDRAALEAVREWRFRPGRQGGVPVESEILVPVRYLLEGV